MKILHFADLHIGRFPGPQGARMAMLEKAVDEMCRVGKEQGVGLVTFGGDWFHRSKLWGDEMLAEIKLGVVCLQKLARVAPVVLLAGTPDHDNPEALRAMVKMATNERGLVVDGNVVLLAENPGTYEMPCRDDETCLVTCLPGYNRADFRARFPGLNRDEESQKATQLLNDVVIAEMAKMVKRYTMPHVLLAHYSVAGELGGMDAFGLSEAVLTPAALETAQYDAVLLGHLHNHHRVQTAPRTVYPGSLHQLTHGDYYEKGFIIWDTDASDFTFYPVPHYKHVSVAYYSEEIEHFYHSGEVEISPEVRDAIVRVEYSCSDEQEKTFDKGLLEKKLYAAGALHVSEITAEEIILAVDTTAMSENATPEDNLADFLNTRPELPAETCARIIDVARPLLADAQARKGVGRVLGRFVPLTLEVENYRSYVQERFDFADITFATVNGPNGIGKSAFFTDAIIDALFEQPREGELTGWIRNTPEAKSGGIKFVFSIGERIFKVCRTRTKSGKATLSLTEMLDGKWVNIGAERIAATQETIETLLGMDAPTFKSCALIMQDAYGLFLEAAPDERMAILSNLLGLGLYADLEEAAREKATVANREVRTLQTTIDALAVAVADIPAKAAAKKEAQAAADKAAAEAAQKDGVLVSLQTAMNTAKETEKRINATRQAMTETDATIATKKQARDQQSAYKKGAETFLLLRGKYADAAEGFKNAEEAAAALAVAVATHKADVARLDADVARRKADQAEYDAFTAKSASMVESWAALKDKAGLVDRQALEDERRACEAVTATRAELQDASTAYMRAKQDHAAAVARLAGLESELTGSQNIRATIREQAVAMAADIQDAGCIDAARAECVYLTNAKQAAARAEELSKPSEHEEQLVQAIAEATARRDACAAMVAMHTDGERYNVRLAEVAQKEDRIKLIDATLADLRVVEAQIQAADETLATRAAQAAKLYDKLAATADAQAQYEDAVVALAKAEYEKAEADNAAWALKHDAEQAARIPAAEQTLQTSTERVAELEADIAALEAQNAARKSEIDSTTLPDTATMAEAIRLTQAEITTARANEAQALQNVGHIKGTLERYAEQEAELQSRKKEQAAAARLASYYEVLKDAFGLNGIPHKIMRSVVGELSHTANTILSQMTGGKMAVEMVTEKVQKSNKKEVVTLEVWTAEAESGTMPYLSRSGGQKVKAALSVAFALAEVKSRRAGIQMGMLFIDEPPFLDGPGAQAYCDALETIAGRYNGMKVLAISHDPSMKERFPQAVTVYKTDGGSKLAIE